MIAKLVLSLEALEYLTIADAVHPNPVNSRCILEVFPNAFLAVPIPDNGFPRLKRDAFDGFWEIAVKNGYMDALISLVLPGVRIQDDLNTLSRLSGRLYLRPSSGGRESKSLWCHW